MVRADRRAIPVYLLVTWTVSSLFYFLIIKSAGTNAANGAYTTGLMWCPAIGALLTCEVSRSPDRQPWLAVGPNPLPSSSATLFLSAIPPLPTPSPG